MNRRKFLYSTAQGALMLAIPSKLLARTIPKPTVLITGTSSGFGRQIALEYARAGFRTYASMRDIKSRNRKQASSLLEIGEAENLDLKILQLDVTNSDEINSAVNRIISESGQIDVLINNAGIFCYAPMEVIPRNTWRLQMETNLYGPMELVSKVLPSMRKRDQGLIIQVSSRVGKVVIPGIGLYCSSKSALEAATEASYYETTNQNIDFAIIQPSAFKTNVNKNAKEIFNTITLPEAKKENPESVKFFQGYINQLNQDFSGTPTRNPDEIAKLALRIFRTPRARRVLRYPIGDSWEINPLKSTNQYLSNMQESALQGRYKEWYRK